MSTSPVPTMQALVLASPDGALTPTWLPRPQPAAGQVLVRIHASGVNPLDTKIRAGAAEHAQQPLPAVLGMDLAGVVEAVGQGVSRFKVGDAVYGFTGGIGGLHEWPERRPASQRKVAIAEFAPGKFLPQRDPADRIGGIVVQE